MSARALGVLVGLSLVGPSLVGWPARAHLGDAAFLIVDVRERSVTAELRVPNHTLALASGTREKAALVERDYFAARRTSLEQIVGRSVALRAEMTDVALSIESAEGVLVEGEENTLIRLRGAWDSVPSRLTVRCVLVPGSRVQHTETVVRSSIPAIQERLAGLWPELQRESPTETISLGSPRPEHRWTLRDEPSRGLTGVPDPPPADRRRVDGGGASGGARTWSAWVGGALVALLGFGVVGVARVARRRPRAPASRS